ncbi:MAG: PIN domain-containing protein [Prosthecobacter sp.]|uniref:PIN domain-containing protein n=1 Tax=Prosthecobacter sp. TaxID=1965333 RepID=UPI0039042281
MKYLLDTNIISELMREVPDPRVVAWVDAHDAEVCLCSLVLSELASGLENMADGKRKAALARELRFVQEDYRGLILPFDESAAWEWARYTRELKDAGYSPPLLDSQIAATARAWSLKLVTRNEDDFPLIAIVNPFKA